MSTAEKLHKRTNLLDLVKGLVEIADSELPVLHMAITGIQMDSRLLRKGDLFIACFGRNHDARNYVDQAIAVGSSAVLVESGGEWHGLEVRANVPIIAIDNLATKISEIGNRFFGKPSEKLNVIGITGTNGKTSCSQFIAQSLFGLGYKCSVIGTLGYGLPGELKETTLTTPDALLTQKVLSEMVNTNIGNVAMEVSSVGLHQKRVFSVQFDTAIFTNLSRDHLDYHKSMEDYAENKKELFTMPGLKAAIINLDDTFAVSVINSIASNVEVFTYSVNNKNASVYAEDLNLSRNGYNAKICTPIGKGKISGKLIGYFNFSNVLAVVAFLVHFSSKKNDIDIAIICEKISNLQSVAGRMEIIGDKSDITVVVDYAHTPDSLKNALTALQHHFRGKVWCVFGCGGNRDQGKRPMMGEIAEKYADHLIVTDDNPRNEEGDNIVHHILSGMNNQRAASVIRDRAKAIALAISHANPQDVVLIAGKGHEAYQDVSGIKNIFSDSKQVRLGLQNRGS